MLRNLCKLRKNILMARIVYSGCAARSNIGTSSRLCALKPDDSLLTGISVTDINIHDIAKGDHEFTRNFLTTLTSLQTESVLDLLSPNKADEASNPDPEPSGNTNESSVLDKDGQPVVPIEIDGWKNAEGDEEGPTVQSPGDSIAIGDEDEYKAENLLIVPAKREGQVTYKGIKIKMPEKASLDVGTYRFRRNKEELESVGDDMRLAKFDK